MQPYARVLVLAMLSASISNVSGHAATKAEEESEEIMVSEHPPQLVYFRHATRSPTRIARRALRIFCREQASQHTASASDPDEGPAIAYLCGGGKATILMGVNHRDEFNRTLYACRADMDFHYVVYPLYWRDVLYDPQWCARIGYDSETQNYRVEN